MDKEQLKGSVDLIILALLSNQDEYGGAIIKHVYRLSSQEYKMSEGTLYTVLKRLEQKGYVRSYWGEESLGGRRKYYTITDDGGKLYEEKLTSWRKISGIIENSIKGWV
jgi:PadR family transcriptional regulator, regulatory protein PadR